MTIEEIKEHYAVLQKIVDQVRISWVFHGQLFNSGEENWNLLNKSAGVLFHVIFDSLNVSVVLRICAVTDKSKNAGHDNLSFMQLAEQIREIDSTNGAMLLCKLNEEAHHFERLRREVRNKTLAHTDLESGPNYYFQRTEIDEAIEALLRILDVFEAYLQPPVKRWHHFPKSRPGSTGNDLLHILGHRESLIAENAKLRSVS